MKNIYNSLLAVAAALLLVPSAYAQTDLPVQYQHEEYRMNASETIGYNKYLVSDTPDANGEYTLRIENFVTGKIDSYAVPTDFVLVLDCSGSMQFDYRLGLEKRLAGVDHPITDGVHGIPAFISVADNNRVKFLRKDDHFENYDRYTYVGLCKGGNYNATASSFVSTSTYWFQNEGDENASSAQCSRYYYYQDNTNPDNTGYYIIYHKTTKPASTTYYHLCIRLNDGTEKYLYDTGVHDTPATVNANNKVIYLGDTWRMDTRREALLEAMGVFTQQIKAQNVNDSQWKSGVTRHRIAIVSFGNNYQRDNGTSTSTTWNDSYLVERTNRSSNTKLVKDFTVVTEDNVTDTQDAFVQAVKDRMTFGGYTDIDFGVHMAMRLLAVRGTVAGMEPLKPSGSVNRNKVVVVLTDGSPNNNNNNPASTLTMNNTLADGITIKKTGFKADKTQEINGKIFTIDLWCHSYSPLFLGHLSSNYPDGNHTGTASNTDVNTYTGTPIPQWDEAHDPDHEHDLRIYYQDASKADLSEIFSMIADASSGESKQMVAVDAMSDDFVIPFTSTDVNRVKIYTAQCIGKKTINGKEYLAFAREVLAPTRESVAHLWVPRAGEGDEVDWIDLGDPNPSDIDGTSSTPKITFSVSDDGKKIIVKGFNYADYFCGIDPNPDHTEGVNANERQMAADDYNAAYADPENKYRGFKLIFEFPIALDPDALGGVNVPTNDVNHSGLYLADQYGNPTDDAQVNYPTPDLPVPVRLIIQKTGLKPGESANFTVQRKLRTDTAGEYEDFTTFVLTGDANNIPEVRIINLDPAYFYKVKEGNWSWAYQNVSSDYYSTDPDDPNAATSNPIVFENDPIIDKPKHAEAKSTNKMYESSSEAITVNSK